MTGWAGKASLTREHRAESWLKSGNKPPEGLGERRSELRRQKVPEKGLEPGEQGEDRRCGWTGSEVRRA